jgi:hypothetical protein
MGRRVTGVKSIEPVYIRKVKDLNDRLAVLRTEGVAAIHRMPREDQRLLWFWSQNILAAYNRTLTANPGNLRRVRALPHPKSDIKLALRMALMLHVHRRDARAVENLRERYLELASFQDIAVGDRQKLKRTSSGTIPPKHFFPLYSKYAGLAATERIRLLEEFNAYITNLKTITS